MKRKNATRSALFTSIISLLLCVSMLVGTTFAWFTDEVVSGVNTIAAGNLDVELYHGKDANPVDKVNVKTLLFTDAGGNVIDQWEPGVVAFTNLKVANIGSLALKYQLSINSTEMNTVKGTDLTLADALKVAVVKGGVSGTREQVIAAASEWKALESFVLPGVLEADKQSETYGIVIYWQPGDNAVDNQFNMNNGKETNDKQPLRITLGVNLFATQEMYEDDSFGDDYDEGLDPSVTYLFTGSALHQSSDKSGRFVLSDDIKTSDYGDDSRYGYGYEYIFRKGVNYTLDLNGKTITFDSVNENANHNALTYLFVANHAGTKLTINGEGKIYANNSEGYTAAIQGKDGTLINVNGGDYEVDNGIAVWAGAGAHIIINGGSFVNKNASTDHELIYSSGGVIDIYGGFFHNMDGNYTLNVEDRNRATGRINVYGGTYVNFDPSTGGQDPNNIKVADGYKVISETQANGDVWYTVVPVSAVSTVEAANAAMLGGNDDVILAGCDDSNGIINVPATYAGTLILENCALNTINAENGANIIIKGNVVVNSTTGSAITGKEINIYGDGNLTAIAADVTGAFGIGGMETKKINISGITVKEVTGGFDGCVGEDTKYYKDSPEGGAAIGSGANGAIITLDGVHVVKAVGGSKAAGIGARYHTGVTVTINNSTIDYVEGGVSAAGIGGSRVSNGATEAATTVNIQKSTVTAKGGAYGAGIGSGYDTHCQASQPLCTINIADSTINANGGRYAAGVGTGYHNAALAGEIKNSTLNTVSGDKIYKDTYTQAQDIGFGVVDPTREGQQINSKLIYNGTEIVIPVV